MAQAKKPKAKAVMWHSQHCDTDVEITNQSTWLDDVLNFYLEHHAADDLKDGHIRTVMVDFVMEGADGA